MNKLALAVLFLVGCGDALSGESVDAPVVRDLWVDHGQTDACHGSISLDASASGTWECYPYGGNVSGTASGAQLTLMLQATPMIRVTGVVRDYDGAIIGRTDDDRPFVAYLR